MCLIMILRIEFIDTETITMYKNCAVKDIDIYILWYLKIRGYLQ